MPTIQFQYVPYDEIEALTPDERVRKLLTIAQKNKVVLMEGRLKPAEETLLIQKTMEAVSKDFKGIELCTVYTNKKKKQALPKVIKDTVTKFLIGDREGLTVIGPANIIKDIKRNPNEIELDFENLPNKRRR